MTGTTLANIIGMVNDVLTAVWGIFSDMLEAVTSNNWLLITILVGFAGTFISVAFKVIRKARRI